MSEQCASGEWGWDVVWEGKNMSAVCCLMTLLIHFLVREGVMRVSE